MKWFVGRHGARLWLLAVCAACITLFCAGCGSTQKEASAPEAGAKAETISETAVTPEAAQESVAAEAEAALPPIAETMTALEDAKNYLNVMALSRDSLIVQLEYDGFSPEEAAEAADNCGADWNEQAALQARSYLDTMEFTREELVDQLVYDRFTPEQAAYGADNCGAAW